MKIIWYILVSLLLPFGSFAQERIPPAPDAEDMTLQYFFKGAWLPSLDPAEISAQNYSELKNLRYGPDNMGLEGVQGYTKINTTALSTYLKIRNGYQLKTDRTVPSYVIVQAENSGDTASQLWVNETAIPSQGDFAADTEVELNTSDNHYRLDTTGAGLGRFSDAPSGNMTYCNGIECLAWAGEEMRIGGFYTATTATEVLDETDFSSNAEWDITGQFNDTDDATIAYDAGDITGTIQQENADLAGSISSSALYYFSYTLTVDTPIAGGSLTLVITGGDTYVPAANVTLPQTAGRHTVTFMTDDSAATGNFRITATEVGTVTAGSLTLDDFTLQKALENPSDVTDAVNNSLTTTGNTVTLAPASRGSWLVMTNRKIQGVYYDVSSANETASLLTCEYWKNDATWAAVSSPVDGTSASSKSLAQDGWFMFSYASDAAPYHFEGKYLYAYKFHLSAGSAVVKYSAVNAPMQNITDLWDGVPRQPISFQVWRNGNGVFKDWTLEVNEYSYESVPFVAQLDALAATGTDYIIVMSDDRLSGVQFNFMAGYVNKNASIANVLYWNGSAYAAVSGTEVDGTSLSGTAFGKNGLLWWQPPAENLEVKKTEFNVTGYSYKIDFTAALSGTYFGNIVVSGTADNTEVKITTSAAHNLGNGDTVTISGIVGTTEANGTWSINEVTATTFDLTGSVYANAYTSGGKAVKNANDIISDSGDVGLDVVTVIPAQKTVPPFKFPSQYKNRTLLCGYTQGKEGNRCDYSQTASTEIWNGSESSDGGVYALYFGGSEGLTAGHEIYNRYGSQVITLWTAFKDGETYVLKGDSPEDFTISKVSSNIGCPAPLTLTSVEVAYEVAQDIRRNMLIWLSDVGPYTFDGQVLSPIKGVEKYFDPDDPDCVNFDEIGRSSGWYDALKREYNLLIPSGSSQSTNNVWLVYDLLKKKWFRKDTGEASFPQVGFSVQDTYGAKYTYGAIDTGFMMRLENGDSWADTADAKGIEQIVETGDFWPSGNIWDLTRITKIKLMGKRISEQHSITVQHYADTDDSQGLSGVWQSWSGGRWQDWGGGKWVSAALPSVSLYLTSSINRIARDTIRDNLFGWSHRFKFSISTDETTKGFQPLGWGIVFHRENRHDE